MKVNKL